MKINVLKSMVLRNRSRCGLAVLASLISIWFALTPGAAQSRNQKRITSLQIGEASEGSRVTIVSDSALNDYEAFRRGDRFYVRIPLADFVTKQPGFRGDGFDDVQVQKVGDSVVVSFKLQPGAAARVDERSNRLDVIFSAPNRLARGNRTNARSSRGSYVPPDGIVRVNNPQALKPRSRDAAGPVPPGSPGSVQTIRERVVSGRGSDSQATRTPSALVNPRQNSSRRGSNRPSGNERASSVGMSSGTRPESTSGTSRSVASSGTKSQPGSSVSKSGASPSPSKSEPSPTVSKYEPSPAATPSISPGYPALATSSPAASNASSPPVKSPGLTGPQNGKSRGDIALQWIKANRQAAWLGALLLLFILVFLAVLIFRRRRNVVKPKRAGSTLAKPKPSPDVAPNTPAAESPATSVAARDFANENTARPKASDSNPAAAPVASANAPRTSGIQGSSERGKLAPEQAKARSAAVAAPPNHAWVPASSSTGPSKGEDQEREVFEI